MKQTILMMIFFAVSTYGFSQKIEKINLWEKEAPYTLKAIEEDQFNERGNVETVAIPDITVYFPTSGEGNGRAILICPGGGYRNLAINHEGYDIAKFYSEKGYVAAVLKYRLPEPSLVSEPWNVPLSDAKQAIKLIRKNAEKWNIDSEKVGVLGFSAGGHLASSLSVHGVLEEGSLPNFSILIYPVISFEKGVTHEGSRTNLLREQLETDWETFYSNEKQVNSNTPPAFLVHSWDDKAVPAENSIRYAKALAAIGTKTELHLFEKGGHGYGKGNSITHGTASQWSDLSLIWLDQLFQKLVTGE
ncbi:alpha/beta hydrolase [Belliella sp. DSM 107340]|uniref:Alpha/beta hydrolase n=1 Tax=Belliella calami TaxID=2923436 RepID=A0ABS9UQT9_9BACT|nr:alpha/beta hydrolase [Belliella calami]MCH7398893.1 alpha/beta hydrolase [Belliella calami]